TPGGTDFQVAVYDATGVDGSPGNKLAGPIEATALRTGDWTHIDLRSEGIIVNDDFFMVYIQPNRGEESSGLSYENEAHTGRSWQLIDGQFSRTPASEGNYMIRAVVNYEIEKPIITTPNEDLVTKTPHQHVKGTATPTTTVQLKNNGETFDSVKIGEDGTFSFLADLTEGVNSLTVASTYDGDNSVESEPVTVILDTIKPELHIESPKDGDILNEKIVIVEGTASDENLDSVEINGEIASTTDEGNFSQELQ
ncbi:hypothetical protein J4G37_39535, partial [Microvirga sp. 3-52]|nr:hypothetical protein [Microvirga sp. 3-52]